MLNVLVDFDTRITQIISALFPHNPFFDSFFTYLSLIGNSFFVWLIIIFVLIVIEEKKDKRFIFYFLASFIITGIFVNIILKNHFHRPRPPIPVAATAPVYTCPRDFSFPSGHASGAFASAVILSAFDNKRRRFYYLIAFLISLSRIYLGCHYFFDVIFGGLIGSIISQLILHIGFRQKISRENT